MAQSDIKYDKVSIDDREQDSANPNPIALFKNLIGGGGSSGGGGSGSSGPAPCCDNHAGASGTGSHAAHLAAAQTGNDGGGVVVGGTELKPVNFSSLQQKLGGKSQAEKEEHAARMKAMIDAKLASMTPEEIEVFEKKKLMMEKAFAAQMAQQGQGLELQPRILEPKVESREDARDRELLFAVRSGQVEKLGELFVEYETGPDLCVRAPSDTEAHPLVHWAALNDQVEVLRFFADKRCDFDQRNPRGEVALHWASLNGNLRAVHLLIESGCDRTAVDQRGYSALHHAAQFGRTVVCACLLRRGLSIDARDNNGRTPLHWAAYKGEDLCAQWLLDHGADISAQDFEQCLPLHWAALQGLYSMSALLIKNGSLPLLEKKDRTGGTPAALAREKQGRFNKDGYQYKEFQHVADYLETCATKKKDVSALNKRSKHPTWYAWPVLAPIGLWQYYTVVFPETSFNMTATALFVFFYFAEWVAWTKLQFSDPGMYVLRSKSKGKPAGAGVEPAGGSGDGESRITIGGVSNGSSGDTCASPTNPNQPDAELHRNMYHEVLDKGLLVPVCTTCEIVKPLRSKHDRFTDVCIARFDHFCPFMGAAVGANNYREFFFAMFNAGIAMWAWLYLVLAYTSNFNKGHSFFANMWETIGWQMFAWIYLPIALYASLMVGQHIMFISKNITTNEVINRSRYKYLANKQNPYSRGKANNWLEFLGLLDPVVVDAREYYSYFFEGRSEQVERNNLNLSMGTKKRNSEEPMQSHGHNHGGGGGGHGHSHGGKQCHGH